MKKIMQINQPQASKGITISQVIESHIESCKVRGLSSETIRNYTIMPTSFMNCVGNKNIHDITTHDINKFVIHLRERGVNNTSITSYLKTLKQTFKHGDINVEFPSIKQEDTFKQPYTDDEIKLLLAKPKINSYTQWRNWAIVNTFLGTGIRCRTLCNLHINDIDFTNNTIYLRETKTTKKYYIPLSSELKIVLKHYLSLYNHEDDDFLFLSQYGEPITTTIVKQTIHDYNLHRGVSKTSCHLFRHTFAIKYLKNGGNVMYLQNILGHSRLETTRVYLHITEEETKQNFDSFCPLDNVKRKGIKLKGR